MHFLSLPLSMLPFKIDSRWINLRKSPIALACVVALSLFTEMLVYGVAIPCLPILVIERLKGDSRKVGLLFGCYAFGHLLATPITAVFSDRYQNRRYPMLAGIFTLIVSSLFFAEAKSYALLVIARMTQGMAGGSIWTIGFGMVADTFPADRLGAVMGAVLSAFSLGFVLGPAMGGFLYDAYGLQAPFYVCVLVAIIDFIAIVWIAEPVHNTPPSMPDETAPLLTKAGTRVTIFTLLRTNRVLCCLFCTFLSSAIIAGLEPVLPIYLRETFQASVSTIGLMFIAMAIPSFLGPLVGYMSDKLGRPRFILCGMLLMAFATLISSFHFTSLYWITCPMVLLGLSTTLVHTPLIPSLGAIVYDMKSEAYAQVYALYNMAYSMGMFAGPVFAGQIMTLFGFRTLMIIYSIVLLICTPVVFAL